MRKEMERRRKKVEKNRNEKYKEREKLRRMMLKER